MGINLGQRFFACTGQLLALHRSKREIITTQDALGGIARTIVTAVLSFMIVAFSSLAHADTVHLRVSARVAPDAALTLAQIADLNGA